MRRIGGPYGPLPISGKYAAVVTALAILTLACTAATPPLADRAGGAGEPVVLRLGTADFPSAVSAAPIELFKTEVERLSGGDITIEPVYRAAGQDVDRWDQRVAESLMRGDLDLALIPARAFDEFGVTSLRALQAPFLLTDDDVVDRVAIGNRVDDLMSGLPAIGITGLALLPDNLRHPVSFGEPIMELADFRNLAIRTPLSRLSYDLLSALGANPVDLDDPAFGAAIDAGSVSALETTLAAAWEQRVSTVVTANITFFPKIIVLAGNAATLERLSEEQRAFLYEAAGATVTSVIESRPREEAAGAQLCAGGGALVLADAADVASIQAAAAPLYTQLEKDPLTRELIAEFRGLRGEVSEPSLSIRPCGPHSEPGADPSADVEPTATPSGDPASGDQLILNGIYRYEVTEDYLVGEGLEAAQAREESGVHTFTVADGTFSDAWTNASMSKTCRGTYSIAGNLVTFRWVAGCFGDFSARYELAGDDILWSDVLALPPHNTSEDQDINEAFMSVPYVKVGDVPE